MDTAAPLAFPRHADDLVAHDLAEVDAAIELVRRHAARRVRLVALGAPDLTAPVALAHAQAAGIGFRLERHDTGLTLTFEAPEH
jgi:hypothetical protein